MYTHCPRLLALAALASGIGASAIAPEHARQSVIRDVVGVSNASLAPSASRWPGGLHLGVDYYPSQWPEEMWEPDVAAMRDLNVSYVRVNEFDWALLEPREGEYDFTVLDRTLALFERYGLKAVVGTPTASPPDWLTRKYDVAFVDVTNSTYVFGSRRYYSFSSFAYREHSRRITRVLAERYGNSSVVVGWQLDNEFGCHATTRSYDGDAIARFRAWLRAKYGTVEAMNAAQGRVFWSNQYSSFDDVLPPYHEVYTTNNLHTLDWNVFSSDMVIEFAREQTAILREHAPAHAVTTNFMMDFFEFDHHKFAREVGLDISFFDEYPLAGPNVFSWLTPEELTDTLRTGLPDYQALHHALYRGVSGAAYGATSGPHGVMEMQPGVLNWNTYRVSPWAGMTRLWTLEAFASGGDAASYFRWRQVPYAQEQTLSGLHVSDGSRDEGFFEAQQVALEDLPVLRASLAGGGDGDGDGDGPGDAQADVALVFDYPSVWVWDIEPYSGSWDASSAAYTGTVLGYFDLVYAFYSALRRLGLAVDVVGPGQDLAGYRMVVVPSAPVLPAALDAALASYRGGPAVFGPRTAALTADFAYAPGLQPAAGALRDRLPLRVTRVETPPAHARSGVAYGGANYSVAGWEEWVECARDGEGGSSSATVASTSRHRAGRAAACASGAEGDAARWHYLGFNPPADFLVSYLGDVAAAAGIRDLTGRTPGAARDLGGALRLLRRGGLLWAFNYGTEPVAAPEVPDGAELVVGEAGDVPAAGVVVWKIASK